MDGFPTESSGNLDTRPTEVRDARARLRDGLLALLGPDLVALWAYGAAIRADRPARLGDVDTHGVLSFGPDSAQAAEIDALHYGIARDAGLEWDSWSILESEARLARPPTHLLRQDLRDSAWGLHRAHWLAGEVVLLHGLTPSE